MSKLQTTILNSLQLLNNAHNPKETIIMNHSQALQAFIAMHKPDAWKNGMVYSVWEDGEITLEKGGDLFGHRTLHTMQFGMRKFIEYANLPILNSSGSHGRIFVDTKEEAEAARKLIADYELES